MIWLLFGMLFGAVKQVNEIKQYTEIQQAVINDRITAAEMRYNDLTDELNMIYSELDILARIESVELKNGIDTTKPLTEAELKKALATQRKIHALVKRKNRIEYELSRL